MINNRFFIMNTTLAQPEDVQTALQMCIGVPETQKFIDNGTKLVIKTTQSEIDVMLEAYPNYTLQQIMELTHCVEYTREGIVGLILQIEGGND